MQALTDIEMEIYYLIRRTGTIMAKDVPFKKAGVIPSLVRKGLVEIYKGPSSPGSEKRCKYLRCTGENEEI
jgi:hypothetical protein